MTVANRKKHAALARCALAVSVGLWSLPGQAQQSGLRSGQSVQTSSGAVKSLKLASSKSAVVEFARDVGDVIIADPEIADVAARGSRRMAVLGLRRGESNIIFLSRSGRTLLTLEVTVTSSGVEELQDILRRHLPNSDIMVESVNDTVLLSGRARNASDMSQAVQVAASYTGSSPEGIINMISIEGNEQVLLKVNVVEMQRSVIKRLGINLAGSATIDQLSSSFAVGTANGFSVNPGATGGLQLNANLNGLEATLRAMERTGLVRTLAEPNLTAISGESAQFLAGGEFPIPVAQEENRTTIEFKPFGVGLGFTPVVLSDGLISLRVATEVSEITSQGAVTSGMISVPGLKVRRAETTVELPSGGSLVIAGLIQQRSQQSIEGVPFLKDLPVIGALFKSRDFLNEETEMVVIVTPYLVQPTAQGQLRTPDQGLVIANDILGMFFGKFNQVYSVGGGNFDLTRRASGPVGYIIE